MTDDSDLPTHVVYGGSLRPRAIGRRETPTSIARELGPVVYFVRTDSGLIKIGHTVDLANRIKAYGGWRTLLAVQPGTRDDEHALHVRFADDLAEGREFFRASTGLLAYVNDVREPLGMEPVAA